jgi:hypothetical protein
MLENKIVKILLKSIIIIAILNLSGFSFAEDQCSDTIVGPGLPTILGNYIKPDNWDPDFHFDPDNPQEITRNNSVTLKIFGGVPPYSWSVVGSGFSLLYDKTHELSNKLIADDTSQASTSVRVPDYGKWVSQGSWNAIMPRSGDRNNCFCGQDLDRNNACAWDTVWCKGKCCCFNDWEDWCGLGNCCNSPVTANNFYTFGMTGSIVWGTFVSVSFERENVTVIENPDAGDCDSPSDWTWPSQAEVDGYNPPCTPGGCGGFIGSDCVKGLSADDEGKPIAVRKIWAYKYVCQ